MLMSAKRAEYWIHKRRSGVTMGMIALRVFGVVVLLNLLISCVHDRPLIGTDELTRESIVGRWYLEREHALIIFNPNGTGLIEAYIESGHVTIDRDFHWSVLDNRLTTEPALRLPSKQARETYIIQQLTETSLAFKKINGWRALKLTK